MILKARKPKWLLIWEKVEHCTRSESFDLNEQKMKTLSELDFFGTMSLLYYKKRNSELEIEISERR